MTRRLLVSLAFAVSAAAATPEATSIFAEHLETSTRTGETILTGHPYVDYGDVRMTADEIRLNPTTHVATATGHAILTKGPRRLLSDKITYHTNTGIFEVGALRVGEYPVYISGTSATGSADSITIDNARVTVPEPSLFVPTLQAARVFFNANHQIRTEGASVGIGRVRPVSVPSYTHDVHEALVPYVSVSGGYRHNLGVYGEFGLHLPVSENLRIGGDVGLYSGRGLMAGPSGNYAVDRAATTFEGNFRSGFINDYGTRFTDILGRPVPRNRGYVEWQHLQDIGEHLQVTGQLNYWSDSDVVRDFRPAEFFPVQQPDSFVESVYAGHNYFVSLFARFQPNSFQTVQQRLPELRFDLLPLAVGNGFYEQFNASAVVLQEDPLPASPIAPTPGPALKSNRLDAYYGLSRPIHPRDWFTFTPIAGGRITYYSNLDGPRSDYTRALGEIGFDTELHTSGTYDYKNDRWKIDGLRHLFTPRISYRYIPEADKGAAYIPPIDREAFSTYLQPLGLADVRNLDELHGTNTLRLGFDNTLQTRDPVYGSRDLVVLNVANDFLFHRKPGQRDVSEIHTELGVMPARWIELGIYQSFAPQDLTMSEFNTAVTLRDSDEWTVRFSSNFLRHELNDYYLQGSRRLNEVYDALVYLRYNERLRRFDEQSYGIRQTIGNTWRVEYMVTLYEGRPRESRFGFNIRIDAVRF